jgi:hypothetical protein
MPRPSVYTQKLAAKICGLVAEGSSLRAIGEMPGMPPRRTMRQWIEMHPAFKTSYEQARLWWVRSVEEDVNDLADRAQQIAADAEAAGQNANAAVAAVRVQIETKKWLLSKRDPATYGDRQVTELVGAGGKDLMPLPTEKEKTHLALLILGILRPDGNAAPAELPPSGTGIRFIDPPASTGTLLSASPKPEPVEPPPRPRLAFDSQGNLVEPRVEPEPTPAELFALDRERERYLSAVRAEPSPPAPARRRYPRVH